MELRTLRYFLAVCNDGSMSKAAKRLHVTQPALSRQIAALERELACTLLERRSRSVLPTEQGLYLQRRAQEIISLADRTEADFSHEEEIVAGDIHIGAGESDGIRVLAQHMQAFRARYPGVRFHLHSDTADELVGRLERGLDDLSVLMSYPNVDRYHHVRLSPTDAWGVIMRADDPLAAHELVGPNDLIDRPLIMPERSYVNDEVAGPLAAWFDRAASDIEVAATYNLTFNALSLAREGIGRLISFESQMGSEGASDLVFRLLYPPAISVIDVVWKRGLARSNAVRRFLESLNDTCAAESTPPAENKEDSRKQAL